MSKNSLFNVLSLSSGAPSGSGTTSIEGSIGAYSGSSAGGFQSVTTTPEATLTFAGAPAAVTVIWKVLSVAFPSLAASLWLPICLSLIIGVLIYLQGRPPVSLGNSWSGLVFAVINSFTIAATVLGINLAVAPRVP